MLRSRNWFLTWNNHDETSIQKLKSQKGLIRYVVQEEIGEGGTPHLQGVLVFKTQRTFDQVKKIDKRIHWEKCKSLFAAKRYCSDIDKRKGKLWFKGFDIPITVRDPMEGHKPYEWQQKILDLIKEEPDDRSIYWFYSVKGNTGKSTLCKHLVLKHGAILVGGSHKDAYYAIIEFIKKGREPRIVLFDLPRSKGNMISYPGIEGIKNGCFFSAKYESTMCTFNPPHIIIFANVDPERDKLSEDRWKIFNINDDDVVDNNFYLE